MVYRVRDGVWHVDCTTLDHPNVFLVDDDALTLVDAGWPGDHETVRAGIRDAGFAVEDVDRVLVTHADVDHVGTLARLTPALDAPVYLHPREAALLRGDRRPPWTARAVEPLHRLFYRRLALPDLPIRTVDDGDERGGFRAVHTPGHTPGHLAFVHEGRSTVFLGDLAHAWGDHLEPAGRFTSYDASQVPGSVRRLREYTAGLDHACPGHGPVLSDPHARLGDLLD